MNNDIFSDSITAITDADFANNTSDNFKVISVRPGDKASALIEVMTEMNNNKLPLARFADLISEELAEFTIERKEHIECLKKVASQFTLFDKKSALGILHSAKVIRYDTSEFDSLFSDDDFKKDEKKSEKESQPETSIKSE